MRNLIFSLLLCIPLLAGCSVTQAPRVEIPSGQTEDQYQTISSEQAHEMMAQTQDYILLDVRTEEEFKEKRIDGAILIPDYDIKSRAEQELTDKNALILIYCRTGRRSANVASEMIEMGYTNVYDFGGINDWPYDTIGG